MRLWIFFVLLTAIQVASASAAPDTLVVCPATFRAALAPWETYRREQGHELLVVEPPASADELHATIRLVAAQGQLKYLVLVGDVPSAATNPRRQPPITVPTQYVAAHVNTHWGSEPFIATDQLYADVDDDRAPDLAVGRIPADSPKELAAVVRKILRYEERADYGLWRRRINVVAGSGGFSPVADALVEAAGRQIMQQSVPPGYAVGLTMVNTRSDTLSAAPVSPLVRKQFSGGCLAWVYLGHGLPTELDRMPTADGPRPIMCVADVPHLQCGVQSPLVVLIACYTGAVDAPDDCLAEELLLADEGPVAVIAATRVTMPYGNAVLGHELLRACFSDQCESAGDMLGLAQQRTLAEAPDDPLRTTLDALARGLSPAPADLAGERREHVFMYHLLGDPLLRIARPQDLSLQTSADVVAGDVLRVDVSLQVAGECLVELSSSRDQQTMGPALASVTQQIEAGRSQVSLSVPVDAAGRYTVRAFVHGQDACAFGATSVLVRRRPVEQAFNPDAGRRLK